MIEYEKLEAASKLVAFLLVMTAIFLGYLLVIMNFGDFKTFWKWFYEWLQK